MTASWSRESGLVEVGLRLTGQSVTVALVRVGKKRKLAAKTLGTMALNTLPWPYWAKVNAVYTCKKHL